MWRAHIPELLPAPFPEFLQHILAFLIQLIPRSSGLCCSSAQEMVGQSQPAAHGRSHGTAPGTPRSHQGSREPPLSPSAAHTSQSTFQGRGDGTAGRWVRLPWVCFWKDLSQKCWGVVFSSCRWFQWVPRLWELLQVSSLPEETIPAAELTQAGKARPGGD